ncbi:MAG: NfrA family protein [Alphaproteobacteria bacterium]
MWRWVVGFVVVAILVAGSQAESKSLREMREEGYAKAARGDCATAYEIFRAAAGKSGGAAYDHLAAANCAVELARTEDAIAEFYRALAHREELSLGDRVYALKGLAYQLEIRRRYPEACAVWEQALALKEDAEIRALYARCLDLAGEHNQARRVRAKLSTSQLRTSGYKLAERGLCDGAYPLFDEAARRTGSARDYLSAANCASASGRTEAAIAAYYAALAKRKKLRKGEVIEALRGLSYQLELAQRWREAAEAREQLLANEESAENRLWLALDWKRAGNAERAGQVFASIDDESLPPYARGRYWREVAAAKRTSDPEGAAAAREQAAMALEVAHRADPANAAIAFELANVFYEQRRYDLSAAMYEAGLAADPGAYAVIEDAAYAHKAAGQDAAAARRFRQVIDNQSRYPQNTPEEANALKRRLWNVQREIGLLEHRWYVYSSLNYRSDTGPSVVHLPESGSLASGMDLEAGWRVPNRGADNGALDLFARAYSGFTDNDLAFDSDAVQLAVGARWQPIPDFGFYLVGERLIKAGENSRNGWLIAGAYFTGTGLDWDPVEAEWTYASLYAQAAYIIDSPQFFSAFAEGIAGRAWKIGDYWAVIPHVVGALHHQDDDGITSSLAEVGAGIMFRHWFLDDKYEGPRAWATLSLQYRRALAREGLQTDDDVFVAQFTMRF